MIDTKGIQKMAEVGTEPLVFILIASLLSSLLISHLYLRFYGSKGTGSTIHRAFPLLGVAITAIFVSLQFSVPLSLGLLGALSIVRFRTPIKDPEEIGFILLVIASSLSCATFNFSFLVVIILISICGLLVLKYDKTLFRKSGHEGLLNLSVPNEVYNNAEAKIFEALSTIKKSKTDSITENIDQIIISLNIHSFSDEVFQNLRQKIKEISPEIQMNVYFNNSLWK